MEHESFVADPSAHGTADNVLAEVGDDVPCSINEVEFPVDCVQYHVLVGTFTKLLEGDRVAEKQRLRPPSLRRRKPGRQILVLLAIHTLQYFLARHCGRRQIEVTCLLLFNLKCDPRLRDRSGWWVHRCHAHIERIRMKVDGGGYVRSTEL